jgi:hypothetical protein
MKKQMVIIGLLGLALGIWQMSSDLTIVGVETQAIESVANKESSRHPGQVSIDSKRKADGVRNQDDGNILVMDAANYVCEVRTGKYPPRKRVNPYHWESYYANVDEDSIAVNSRRPKLMSSVGQNG